jgi:hypothetical protein
MKADALAALLSPPQASHLRLEGNSMPTSAMMAALLCRRIRAVYKESRLSRGSARQCWRALQCVARRATRCDARYCSKKCSNHGPKNCTAPGSLDTSLS